MWSMARRESLFAGLLFCQDVSHRWFNEKVRYQIKTALVIFVGLTIRDKVVVGTPIKQETLHQGISKLINQHLVKKSVFDRTASKKLLKKNTFEIDFFTSG